MTNPSVVDLLTYARINGGFTVDPETFEHLEADAGFMVAAGGELETRVHMGDHSAVRATIRDLQISIQTHRLKHPNHTQDIYLGGWVDPADPDVLFIEVTEHIYGLETALITGRRRKQQAIYSFKQQRSISLEHGKHNQG